MALGFSPSDVERLVTQISIAIGLSPSGIKVIPCDGVREGDIKAQSISYFKTPGIPDGDYILYDPVWVREVIGPNLGSAANIRSTDKAIVLFGHELGHLLGRDFTVNSELPQIQKETAADHFAGCAAGALGVSWDNVADILSRLRGDVDTNYPSREHSLAAARKGFDGCSRATIPPPVTYGEIVGGPGGLPFEEGCKANEVLVGLYGCASDARVFSVGPICGSLRNDPLHENGFALTALQRDGTSYGSSEGDQSFRLVCPIGTAIIAYQFDAAAFSNQDVYLVDHLGSGLID